MIPGIILHEEIYDGIKELTDEQTGVFIRGALKFAFDGVLPEFDDVTLRMLWNIVKRRLDEDRAKYEKISKKRSDAVSKRWKNNDTNVDSEIQMNTNANSKIQKIQLHTNVSTEQNRTEQNISEQNSPVGESNKHRFGAFSNVILTQEEYDEWLKQCPKADYYIERLSEYIENTGKKYANHLATMRKWWLDDKTKETVKSYDLDEHTKQAVSKPLAYKKRNEIHT